MPAPNEARHKRDAGAVMGRPRGVKRFLWEAGTKQRPLQV